MPYSEPSASLFARSDLEGETLVWLLEVQVGGLALRWSSRPVDVVTEQGEILHFPGGLDADEFERKMEVFSDNSEPPEASFTTLPAPPGLASLIAGGATIAARPGQLSLWVEGTTYERRQIMVWGTTRSPRYGTDRDPVAFTLGERALDDGALFPEPGAVIESGKYSGMGWSTGDVREADEGKTYPVIFGQPGGTHTGAKGTAAYVVHVDASGAGEDGEVQYLLIAYGRVAAQWVKIYPMDGNAEAAPPEIFRTLTGTDDDGQVFTYVDVISKGGAWALAPSYFVGWIDPAGGLVRSSPWHETDASANAVDTTGRSPTPSATRFWNIVVVSRAGFKIGDRIEWVDYAAWEVYGAEVVGLPGAFPSEIEVAFDVATGTGPKSSNDDWFRRFDGASPAVNGAGEAAIFMLEQSTKTADVGRWQSLRPRMNAYQVDIAIREPVSPWDWVRKHLLRDFLPVSITSTPDGVAPVWWRYDARAVDAVAHIEVGAPLASRPGCVASISGIEYDGELGDVVTYIHLKYRPAGVDGTFKKGLAIRGWWNPLITRNRISNVAAQRAHALHGKRRVGLSTHVTAREATASQMLGWLIVRDGFVHRGLTAACGKEYAHLQPGDVVTLTSPEHGELNRVALVTGLTLTDGPWMALHLQLVTNPATAGVSTGPNPDAGEKAPVN